jgi:hypothetical protein
MTKLEKGDSSPRNESATRNDTQFAFEVASASPSRSQLTLRVKDNPVLKHYASEFLRQAKAKLTGQHELELSEGELEKYFTTLAVSQLILNAQVSNLGAPTIKKFHAVRIPNLLVRALAVIGNAEGPGAIHWTCTCAKIAKSDLLSYDDMMTISVKLSVLEQYGYTFGDSLPITGKVDYEVFYVDTQEVNGATTIQTSAVVKREDVQALMSLWLPTRNIKLDTPESKSADAMCVDLDKVVFYGS